MIKFRRDALKVVSLRKFFIMQLRIQLIANEVPGIFNGVETRLVRVLAPLLSSLQFTLKLIEVSSHIGMYLLTFSVDILVIITPILLLLHVVEIGVCIGSLVRPIPLGICRMTSDLLLRLE